MTDLIDSRNVGAISALTRAMANAIAPSNVGARPCSYRISALLSPLPPLAVLLGSYTDYPAFRRAAAE